MTEKSTGNPTLQKEKPLRGESLPPNNKIDAVTTSGGSGGGNEAKAIAPAEAAGNRRMMGGAAPKREDVDGENIFSDMETDEPQALTTTCHAPTILEVESLFDDAGRKTSGKRTKNTMKDSCHSSINTRLFDGEQKRLRQSVKVLGSSDFRAQHNEDHSEQLPSLYSSADDIDVEGGKDSDEEELSECRRSMLRSFGSSRVGGFTTTHTSTGVVLGRPSTGGKMGGNASSITGGNHSLSNALADSQHGGTEGWKWSSNEGEERLARPATYHGVGGQQVLSGELGRLPVLLDSGAGEEGGGGQGSSSGRMKRGGKLSQSATSIHLPYHSGSFASPLNLDPLEPSSSLRSSSNVLARRSLHTRPNSSHRFPTASPASGSPSRPPFISPSTSVTGPSRVGRVTMLEVEEDEGGAGGKISEWGRSKEPQGFILERPKSGKGCGSPLTFDPPASDVVAPISSALAAGSSRSHGLASVGWQDEEEESGWGMVSRGASGVGKRGGGGGGIRSARKGSGVEDRPTYGWQEDEPQGWTTDTASPSPPTSRQWGHRNDTVSPLVMGKTEDIDREGRSGPAVHLHLRENEQRQQATKREEDHLAEHTEVERSRWAESMTRPTASTNSPFSMVERNGGLRWENLEDDPRSPNGGGTTDSELLEVSSTTASSCNRMGYEVTGLSVELSQPTQDSMQLISPTGLHGNGGFGEDRSRTHILRSARTPSGDIDSFTDIFSLAGSYDAGGGGMGGGSGETARALERLLGKEVDGRLGISRVAMQERVKVAFAFVKELLMLQRSEQLRKYFISRGEKLLRITEMEERCLRKEMVRVCAQQLRSWHDEWEVIMGMYKGAIASRSVAASSSVHEAAAGGRSKGKAYDSKYLKEEEGGRTGEGGPFGVISSARRNEFMDSESVQSKKRLKGSARQKGGGLPGSHPNQLLGGHSGGAGYSTIPGTSTTANGNGMAAGSSTRSSERSASLQEESPNRNDENSSTRAALSAPVSMLNRQDSLRKRMGNEGESGIVVSKTPDIPLSLSS